MRDDATDLRRRVDHLVRGWIGPARCRARAAVDVESWDVPDEPVPFTVARAARYSPYRVGTPWSRPWGTTWFHVRGEVPASWTASDDAADELAVDLGFDSSEPGFQAEALAFRPDGTVVKGVEPLNAHLPVEAGPGETFEVYIEAAANPSVMRSDWTTPSPLGSKRTAGGEPIYAVRALELRRRDLTVSALLLDLEVVTGLVDELPATSPRRARLVLALRHVLDALDPDDVAGTAAAARDALRPALDAPATPSAHTVYAVGHAHIDCAWLWPVRETIRKVGRTFSNALDLMDRDPSFVFAASSAQQYAWVQRRYPDVFERIRSRVREGRWIPVGGMWVEPDANMTGGESLIRQLVAGKRYFLDQFGVEPREIWLPDSFGYSAALPEIARQAGSWWMLTQKISWNDTNRAPYHTFLWEGLDGTRLFTHFPPADTYNSDLSAADLLRAERRLGGDGRVTRSLLPFGYGDGGGGPTREEVGLAHRWADLEGAPRVRMTSPEAFFEDAQAECPDPPVWVGELYLENHRGTLTSQHRTKAGNRRCEALLRAAELWAATATLRRGAPYPYDELTDIWHTVLLQQFHDILPGSAIAWVREDAEENYETVIERIRTIIARSLRALTGPGREELLANAGPFAVEGIPSGAILPERRVARPHAVEIARRGDGGYELDNGRLRVAIEADGLVHSLRDLERDREVVPDGRALGSLRVYRDIPNDWDAWNVDLDDRRHGRTMDRASAIDGEVGSDGVARVRVTRSDGASAYRQTLALAPGENRLVLTTEVDWHERHKLLKLEFPVSVHATRAQSEVQFGYVDRPIHTNTSWDVARFETVGLRWVRVAEPGFGVAVANDQTYGHSFQRESGESGGYVTIGESLLRAPVAPDPEADQGRHVLHTSIVVGATTADAIREGYRMNVPLERVRGGASARSIVRTTAGTGVIEAVKLADDRSGDLVVRLYESAGARASTSLRFDAGLVRAQVTDALERTPSPEERLPTQILRWETGKEDMAVALRPFQIVTLRVRLQEI